MTVPLGAPCYGAVDWSATCDTTPDGGGVTIGGEDTSPGSEPGSDGGGGGGSNGGGGDGTSPTDSAPVDDTNLLPGPGECTSRWCRPGINARIPAVTQTDIASFRPAGPELATEPAGLGVAGLPANLVASGGVQVIPGRLFDRDVSVTFTPVRFVFAHGDGTHATSPTGGSSWESLGQAQFTPTATSHTYASPGTYVVTATIVYTATVDFGIAVIAVPGEVTASSAAQEVRILEARTALVDRTCAENPRAPGC